jgi:ATP-binding cassette subfamily B protein
MDPPPGSWPVADFRGGLRLMVEISWAADRRRSIAAVVTAIGQMVAAPLISWGVRHLVDGVLARDRSAALLGVLMVVGFTAAGRLMTWASLNVRMRLRENTQLYLDARLMGVTAGIPGIEHLERPDYLDQVELIREERSYLANPFNPISWTLASVVQGAGVVALLAGVSPWLALLPLFGLPSLLAALATERSNVRLRESQAEPERMRRHLLELTTMSAPAKEIRIFGLGEELIGRRHRLFLTLERARLALATRNSAITALGWVVFTAGYVAAMALAIHLAASGRATVGAVVLVLSLGAQVNQQLTELAQNLAWAVDTHRAVGRLGWLLDLAERSRAALEPASPLPVPARLNRGIALEGVSFRYPGTDRDILKDVDLLLPAGQTVAIVGDNGSGKTTLAKLLCRLYQPTTGRITVDGTDLGRLSASEWRRRTSAGFQDFARLQLLARESIGVGETALIQEDAALRSAMARASADDLMAAFPRGLDTQLGREFQDGVELSIGQWQKAAISRAMMRRNPLLLILDEPTASLDAPTEHALFERFAGAAREAAARHGTITLLVSHRFSTVRMADLILVVAGGRIAEAGDHATLMRAGGAYAQLYELQARGYR